ncbi:GDSL family lipase, partial [Francisella tularensis]|nr:GDSL family lipase [Francisella tularensis]
MLISNPKPKVLQKFNNIHSNKINMVKNPKTSSIPNAILTAENTTMCTNSQEFKFLDEIHPTYK